MVINYMLNTIEMDIAILTLRITEFVHIKSYT